MRTEYNKKECVHEIYHNANGGYWKFNSCAFWNEKEKTVIGFDNAGFLPFGIKQNITSVEEAINFLQTQKL